MVRLRRETIPASRPAQAVAALVVTACAVAALGSATLVATPAAAAEPAATLMLTSASARITCGESVRLSGVATLDGATAAAGATVAVYAEPAAAPAPVQIATITADAQGRFTLPAAPETTTTYVVQWAAAAGSVSSPALTVEVRAAIALRHSHRIMTGLQASLSGTVSPAKPAGTPVTILRRSRHTWVVWRRVALDDQSHFSASWMPTRPGRLRLLATVAADGANVTGWSHSRVWHVLDSDPHHVPARYSRLIVIDHSEYRLYFYEYGHWIRRFRSVLGKPSTPTPYGHFRIVRKRPHPGGANGAYYMGYLGVIGIHGTDQPYLLRRFPRAYSHGCCRLSNAHITWLYAHTRIGTPVWNVR